MHMKSFSKAVKLNKPGIGLVILALAIGGVSAKAADEINSSSGGYLMCVKHNTNEVTYPTSTSCPKGYTELVLGQPTKYAVGYVLVSRGNGAPSRWASYSTSLGSPYGNTASGTFRFTCKPEKAPCIVSFQAETTSTGVSVYPRVMIYKSSFDSGLILGQCEYADGSGTTTDGFEPVGQTPTSLIVNIGGSLDCGASGQTWVAPGNVSSIMVPAGYYDVQSTFTFKG